MGFLKQMFGMGPLEGQDVAGDSRAAPQAFGAMDLAHPNIGEFLSGEGSTSIGRTVTEKSAMSNATMHRAVTLISGTIGMLPLNLHRRTSAGMLEKAKNHPVHRLLRVRPNAAQTPLQFKSYMQGRALLKGNAYAYKVPGSRGVQALWPLDPNRTRLEVSSTFEPRYRYKPKTGAEKVYSCDEIMHLKAPWSEDGLNGKGLLEAARDALALAQLTDEAAGRLLKNGSYVGGVLEHPKTLSKEAVVRLKEQFQDRHQGIENTGRWMVTEEGLVAKPLGASGKDAEGLAQRKHQAEEISRYTGVPRPLLMFDETSWGSGIEQLGLFFVTYCLLPWFTAWEEVIAQSLLTEAEQETHYAKFNEAALLRGSLKDQAEFLSKAIGGPGQGGWMVPDEARDKMDMNPLPDGQGERPAWREGATDDA